MITIREYETKDYEGVHQTSLKASSHPDKTGDDLKYHYAMYTSYYTTIQTDTSFVAVDEDDKVVGYVLCAKDYDQYLKDMNEKIIPALDNDQLEKRAAMECMAYKKYAQDYPAHLHIDIHPDYQSAGLGSKLMDALKQKLKEQNIKGLMLIVAAKNQKAFSFYKKNNFKVIDENPYCYVMGYEVN